MPEVTPAILSVVPDIEPVTTAEDAAPIKVKFVVPNVTII